MRASGAADIMQRYGGRMVRRAMEGRFGFVPVSHAAIASALAAAGGDVAAASEALAGTVDGERGEAKDWWMQEHAAAAGPGAAGGEDDWRGSMMVDQARASPKYRLSPRQAGPDHLGLWSNTPPC